ncbi:MAG TPA: FAD-binding oxidoreductase [Marmoricola sp.]|nr:FAD-binding oxidoreductase [Marmoricola sp.]
MTHLAEPRTIDNDARAAELKAALPGVVHLPGDAAYDTGRAAWNLTAQQRPAAVALPRTVTEVTQVVRAAARVGLRVAAQNTGHAAGTLVARGLHDVVLVRTTALDGVHVDATHRTARVEGGALWREVVAAAAPHGLTGLHGSAPHVGVTGYTLGGGLSFYARKHGLAATSVLAVEVVTAQGEVVRADERTNVDLFWAVRGGGGNFGIVTALEFRLHPIAEAYAGMLLWDLSRAAEVVRTWAAWCESAPDEVTTSLRVMRFPPIPELPDFLRGRSLVVIDGAVLADADTAAGHLAPLRALEPEMDTFGPIPAAGVTEIHMDPVDPTAAVGAGMVLATFDDAAVDAFLDVVGPGAETPVFIAELRQLGGAVGRPAAGGGALSHLPGSHAAMFLAMAFTPEMAASGAEGCGAVVTALSEWSEGRNFPNFSERPIDPASAYEPEAWERLRRVKAEVDPTGLFLANHEIRAEA